MLILSPADERARETTDIKREREREREGGKRERGGSGAPLSVDFETRRLARDSRSRLVARDVETRV